MPSNTESGFDWGDVINAALAIYANKKGDKTPNFYPVPQTPQEQWKTDAQKNLFNFASGFTNQYLNGLSNLNPDTHLNTSEFGNPAFMGGIKIPTFNFSQIGTPTSPAATPPTDPNKPAGTVPWGTIKPIDGGGSDPSGGDPKMRVPDVWGDTGNLLNMPSAFDPNMNGRPGIDPRYPAGSNPNIVDIFARSGYGTSAGNDGAGVVAGQISDALKSGGLDAVTRWIAQHPTAINAIKAVAAAFGGPVGASAVQLAQWFANWYSQRQQQAPPSTPPQGGNTYNPTNPHGGGI